MKYMKYGHKLENMEKKLLFLEEKFSPFLEKKTLSLLLQRTKDLCLILIMSPKKQQHKTPIIIKSFE